MPIAHTDDLELLIRSLSKSDKRSFRLFAQRNQTEVPSYMKLFDLIDKGSAFDEAECLQKLGYNSKSKLSNLKRSLYSQILCSLRTSNRAKNASIEIRELMDYADLVFAKGLFHQSLKLLQKAEQKAEKHQLNILLLDILERQKMIESRHITRTGPYKNEELASRSSELAAQSLTFIEISNLRLTIHSQYIKYGHVKNEAEYDRMVSNYEKQLSKFDEKQLPIHERILYYQATLWYYFTLLKFDDCLDVAKKWVHHCRADQHFAMQNPYLIFRGYHYILTSAYYLNRVEEYVFFEEEMTNYRKEKLHQFDEHTQMMSFIYSRSAQLNKHVLTGNFQNGQVTIQETEEELKVYKKKLDAHRYMIFYYKFAMILFGNNQPEQAINYLNRIIHSDVENLRQDVQGYAHLLYVLCHYEIGNYSILEYVVKNVRKYFNTSNEGNDVQKYILELLTKLSKAPLQEHKVLLKQALQDLSEMNNKNFEYRAFYYINIIPWLKSKLTRCTMGEVIRGQLVKVGK